MFQDPPSSTTGNELPITREFLEIDCPDSCYFLNIPLDGLVSLQSLRFQSTSRCQEIYDSQENYIGTCTRIPRTSSAGFCVEEMANDVGGVDWNTTQLNLDERLLVSGYLVVKVCLLNTTQKVVVEVRKF